MDLILRGIIESQCPIALKKAFVKKFREAGCTDQTASNVHAMLDCCKLFLLENNSDQTHDWSRQIFSTWAWNNSTATEDYFSTFMVEELLKTNWQNVAGAIWIVMEGLTVLKHCMHPSYNSVCSRIGDLATNFIRDNGDPRLVIDFCEILVNNPLCLPPVRTQSLRVFCSTLLRVVGQFDCSEKDTGTSLECVDRIPTVIGKLLERIWLQDKEALGNSMLTAFDVICSCKKPNAIRCIGAVVQFVPDDCMKIVFSPGSLATKMKDEEVVDVLDKMIFMLSWPRVKNIDQWIICYFRGLASEGRYSLLSMFAGSRVPQLFSEMREKCELRAACFPVLSYLLLSHQHSPAVFHEIVQEIPSYVKELENSSTQSPSDLSDTVVLLHCLMYQHSGFPDLYSPIVDALENFQRPSIETIRKKLSDCVWTKESAVQLASLPGSDGCSDESRSKTGLTGLTNLGNSCYLNAIVQLLHMCDSFRRDVLFSSGKASESVLHSLQQVFAFLAFTQRKAYAPTTFLSTSRPSWFSPGRQQDCSEFLRYLLNVLNDQEQASQRAEQKVASSTLVGKTFGGHTMTTYRCLGCGTCSTREEQFMDLQLAFPSRSTEAASSSSESDRPVDVVEKPDDESVSLVSLLEHFLRVEKLEGANQYRCDAKCMNLENAERSTEIGAAPPYLVLTLLRFCFEGGRHTKKLTDVRYPLSFSLPVTDSDTIEHQSGSVEANCRQKTYGLVGVVVHSGVSSDHGHYYSYARHAEPLTPPSNAIEDRRPVLRVGDDEDTADYFSSDWFMFNDERVTPASFLDFRDVTRKFAHDTAYVLVYREVVDGDVIDERCSAAGELQLPGRLREMVDRDNVLYLEELQKRIKSRPESGFPLFRRSFRDDDYDGGNSPPPNNCGGSGFGNFLQGPPSIF